MKDTVTLLQLHYTCFLYLGILQENVNASSSTWYMNNAITDSTWYMNNAITDIGMFLRG